VDFKMSNDQKYHLFKTGYDTAMKIIPIKTNTSTLAPAMFSPKSNSN